MEQPLFLECNKKKPALQLSIQFDTWSLDCRQYDHTFHTIRLDNISLIGSTLCEHDISSVLSGEQCHRKVLNQTPIPDYFKTSNQCL